MPVDAEKPVYMPTKSNNSIICINVYNSISFNLLTVSFHKKHQINK